MRHPFVKNWVIFFLGLTVFLFIPIAQSEASKKSELKKATDFQRQALKLSKDGLYSQALVPAGQALALREKLLPPNDPLLADSLYQVAEINRALGLYAEAAPLYERALAIREKIFGPGQAKLGTPLNQLAVTYAALGENEKAEALYQRAVDIWEKSYGPDHRYVAAGLGNLASLYYKLGQYAKAEPLFERAIAITEKRLGPQDPGLANLMNQLAMLLTAAGKYEKAEALYKQTLAIWEKSYGPDHRFVATGLGNLASLYYERGDYEKAEPLYERAIEINEKIFGPDHPALANTLVNLAVLNKYRGQYAKAEALYQRALAIQEKNLKPDDPALAATLNNLGEFYRTLGYYDRAEPMLHRALAIREKRLPPDHPHLAVTVDNLGSLYYNRKQYEKSLQLYQRGLAIWTAVLGPVHAEVAANLNNLAGVYYYLGDLEKAGQYYQKATDIWRRALGAGHPRVALGLNNLAELSYESGDLSRAESLYGQALAIREKTLGPDHPLVAASLDDLAAVYAARGRLDESRSLFMRSQEITDQVIRQVMSFTSEVEKLQFIDAQTRGLDRALSLVGQYMIHDRPTIEDSLNLWLKRKGMILEAQKRFQEALIHSDDPLTIKTFQELSRVRARLSRLAFKGPEDNAVREYLEEMEQLKKRKESLETELNKLSQDFALKQKISAADCQKVAQSLPLNSVLIEFAKVKVFNFKAAGKDKWLPDHYYGFVLHGGRAAPLAMIDLGESRAIDGAVGIFRKEITNLSDLKGTGAIKASRVIYDLVFAPLKTGLGEVREIFISPDGNLNLIPFEVLTGPDGRFLIEDYTFNYLAAGRDILGFGHGESQTGPMLLMGDPDFDLDQKETQKALSRLALKTAEPNRTARVADMRGLIFEPLPGTKKEIEEIADLFPKNARQIHVRQEALEEVLTSLETPPRLLHLATHGFFLEDIDWRQMLGQDQDRPLRADRTLTRLDINRVAVNPLLRSGLALAGANQTLASKDPDLSQGLLTAEKILALKLWGTELVVLSACQTGLGEVKAGEGVYGLRRSFVQAGTRGLVMSLWSVPDLETQELMVRFYKNMRSGPGQRGQALRQAMLRQKDIVFERYGHVNPLFWGAFVFLGEP